MLIPWVSWGSVGMQGSNVKSEPSAPTSAHVTLNLISLEPVVDQPSVETKDTRHKEIEAAMDALLPIKENSPV